MIKYVHNRNAGFTLSGLSSKDFQSCFFQLVKGNVGSSCFYQYFQCQVDLFTCPKYELMNGRVFIEIAFLVLISFSQQSKNFLLFWSLLTNLCMSMKLFDFVSFNNSSNKPLGFISAQQFLLPSELLKCDELLSIGSKGQIKPTSNSKSFKLPSSERRTFFQIKCKTAPILLYVILGLFSF